MSDIMQRFTTTTEEKQQSEKYLTFLLDKQFFALPIKNVMEIIAIQEVTQVPEFPSYVKGIINLRGKIIPLIDVRLRFHKAEADYDERTSVIVVSIDTVEVGFIVDMVDEVMDIDYDNIAPPPRMSETSGRYITGVGKIDGKIILLLDSDKLLNEEEINGIAQAM